MYRYLRQTPLLDYGHADIKCLIAERGWQALPERGKIAAVYNFVKDEIKFAYNPVERIPASQVLRAGYGQCNTKAVLLMTLLRGCGVPCRLHAFAVRKELQRGVLTGIVYWLAPRQIQHSWVEAQFEGEWLALEGVILDPEYIAGVRAISSMPDEHFCGFAVAADNLRQLVNEWRGTDTYIQHRAIVDELGMFDTPDDYYETHKPDVRGLKALLWRLVFCQRTNAIVQKIRGHGLGLHTAEIQSLGRI